MEVTFLGTGAGVPSRLRNVSATALRPSERGELWLFDCGEGTQHQFIRSDLKMSRISRIFITHLHGDHIFGLPGLLSTCSLAGDPGPIALYGPPGLEEYVRTCFRCSGTTISFPLEFHVVEEGTILDDGGLTVRCRRLDHRIDTFGYAVAEAERPGSFDARKAALLGIPSGPVYGRLKRGETVILPDGRSIDGRALCGRPEPGRSLALCSDTGYSPGAVDLASGVDLLIHEATFTERHADLAALSLHSTSAVAARVALEGGARRLVLTHISSRYAEGHEESPSSLLAEARTIFPETELAEDFTRVVVERRRA